MPEGCFIAVDQEIKRNAIWINLANTNARQTFTATLHPEPLKIDLCQLRAEVTSCGRVNLYLRAADGGLVLLWVVKAGNRAADHFNSHANDPLHMLAGNRI